MCRRRVIFVDIFEYRESELKVGSMCVLYFTIFISALIMPQLVMLGLIILAGGVIFGIYLVIESNVPRTVEIDDWEIRHLKNGRLKASARVEEASRVVYGFYDSGEGGVSRVIEVKRKAGKSMNIVLGSVSRPVHRKFDSFAARVECWCKMNGIPFDTEVKGGTRGGNVHEQHMPMKDDSVEKWNRRLRILLVVDAVVLVLGISGLAIGLDAYRNSGVTNPEAYQNPIAGFVGFIGVLLVATAPALLWGTVEASINRDAWKSEEFQQQECSCKDEDALT